MNMSIISDVGIVHNVGAWSACNLKTSAGKRSIGSTTGFHNHGEGPYSWLKAPTSAFTFKTLLRHYAKRALTPR